jgi:hypothetical protein
VSVSNVNTADPPRSLDNDWDCNLQDFPKIPPFTGNSGLFLPEGTEEPLDIFNIIYYNDILFMFSKETNRYARSKINALPHSFFVLFLPNNGKIQLQMK